MPKVSFYCREADYPKWQQVKKKTAFISFALKDYDPTFNLDDQDDSRESIPPSIQPSNQRTSRPPVPPILKTSKREKIDKVAQVKKEIQAI